MEDLQVEWDADHISVPDGQWYAVDDRTGDVQPYMGKDSLKQWLTQLATDAVPKYGKVIIPTGEYTKGDIVAQVNVRDGIRGTIDQIKSKSSNFRIAVLKNFTGTL